MADNELDRTIEELEAEVLAELEEANGQDAPKKSGAPADKMDKAEGEVQDMGKAVVDPEQKDAPAKKVVAKAKEVGGQKPQKGEGKPDKMDKLKEDEDENDENDDDEELRDITIVSMVIDRFCPNSNLGESLIHAFIVNDKIAGISIEVVNGTNNEESKKKLLYNYVIANYGSIENSSNTNWTGYKTWSIGGKEIIYSKTYYRKKFLIEELLISNAEYMPYLIDNEPND